MANWNLPDDQRKTGLKRRSHDSMRTPSGHSVVYDDTKGAESITVQHRTGSLMQMQADGTIILRSEKDKYEVVFGHNKMLITGHWDITVNGGASMKVEGDYDVAVNGNMKTTVKGNQETVVNGNRNVLVNGKDDLAVNAGQTTKVKGNTEHTTEGKTYLGADVGVKVESTGGSTEVAASTDATVSGGSSSTVKTGSSGVAISSGSVSMTGATFLGQNSLGGQEGTKVLLEGNIPSSKIKGVA